MKEVTIEAVKQDPIHIEAGNDCYGCMFENNCTSENDLEAFRQTGVDCVERFGDDLYIYKIKEK